MSPDQFKNVEDEFFRLKGQVAAGRITQPQFEAALKDLMVQDAQSRYWMIGADTGKWYVHDGKSWVEAQPPGRTEQMMPPSAPMTPARRGNALPIIAILAIVGICLLAGLVGIFIFLNQGGTKVTTAPTNTSVPGLQTPIIVGVATTQATLTSQVPTAPAAIAISTVTPTPAASPTITKTLGVADYIKQGDELTFQSKFAEATAAFQNALRLDPVNVTAFAYWARLLDFQARLDLNLDNYNLAISKAEAGSQLAPNNAEVAIWLSRAYDWNANYDKALTAAQNAVRLAPDSSQANAVLAEALLDTNKLADAEAAAQKAIQLDPNNADAHRARGLVFNARQQTQAAVAEFEKAAQLEPNLAWRFLALGNFYRNIKENAKAIEAYQKAIALYPQATSAWVGLGDLYREAKQFDPAIDNHTKATQANDKSPTAFFALGQTFVAADRCADAIAPLQKTIELNSRANVAMTILGQCQLKLGNPAEALQSAQKAAAIDPNNPDTKNLLAALGAALATPAPAIPPGFYVTQIRSEPSPPRRGQSVGFHATFLNTTGATQNYRWLVYIYRVSNLRSSFGETAAQDSSIAVGTFEIKTRSDWNTGVGLGCEDYLVRVAWLDQNRQAIAFSMPDGKPAEIYITVCP